MDQFERIKKIGKGNFGDVLLVRSLANDKLFALKRVDLERNFAVDPMNEAKVLKSLDHPNIIAHYDSFLDKNKLCILMEYADNADLGLRVRNAITDGRYIEEETVLYSIDSLIQILDWFTQVTMAIQYLHSQKVLHRDIKVQNIFLCNDGIIKLGDFGICRTLENTLDLAQTSIGTPFYLCPEICQNKSYNHKIDIWMLGCALFELCSLEKPFRGGSINQIANEIMSQKQPRIPDHYSPALQDLVDSMLLKDPDQRPEISAILQLPIISAQLQRNQQTYNFNYQMPKKHRMHQNSIHFMVEKSKQSRSPLRLNLHTESECNSPNFRQLQTLGDDEGIHSERQVRLKYQKKLISINIEDTKRSQQDTVLKTQFTFADQLFKPTTPKSPIRNFLLIEFLKRKIGVEKFIQIKTVFRVYNQLLESSQDALKLLDTQQHLILEILGDNNMDCIKLFKLLITTQTTPSASHFRNKQFEEHSNISKTPKIENNFEISFKNLQLQ